MTDAPLQMHMTGCMHDASRRLPVRPTGCRLATTTGFGLGNHSLREASARMGPGGDQVCGSTKGSLSVLPQPLWFVRSSSVSLFLCASSDPHGARRLLSTSRKAPALEGHLRPGTNEARVAEPRLAVDVVKARDRSAVRQLPGMLFGWTL